MPRNIEIKAKIADRKPLIIKVENIADSGPLEIRQDDTFFSCTNGRLKLRQLSPILGELIYYERPDISGPKTSTYVITVTTEPEQLRKTLELALGVTGRVRKKRLLYMCGATRIHVDEVEGLGDFVEIEVVIDDSDTVEAGQRIAEEMMKQLDIKESDLLTGAYVDMIACDPLGSSLNPNYTLERFLESSNNQFAYAAAVAVVDNPGYAFNPLYIYGGSGVGKSHLLNAIGYSIRKNMPDKNIYYCTAENFVNDVEKYLRISNKMDLFRNSFRTVDVFLIDDIQFMSGRFEAQKEFIQIFHRLCEAKKQIVITSNIFPREIPGLDERLRSRLEWGLIADIMTPNKTESDQISQLCDEISKNKWRLIHTPKFE